MTSAEWDPGPVLTAQEVVVQGAASSSEVHIHQIGPDAAIEIVDQNGLAYKIQADTTAPSSLNVVAETGNSPNLDIITSAAPGGNSGAIILSQSSTFQGVVFDNADGYLKPGGFGGGTYTVEGWTALTLQNGWTNFGVPWAPIRCRRLPTGHLFIEGTIAPGTTTNGTVLFNLPSGFRPLTYNRRQPLPEQGGMWADFLPSGDVQIHGATGAGSATFCGLISLQ